MAPSHQKAEDECSKEELTSASEDEAVMPGSDECSTSQTSKKKPSKVTPLEDCATSEEGDSMLKIGKRERKKVINFVADSPVAAPKKLDLDQGSGVPLDNSPYINHMINVTKSDELKFFHKILFLRPGSGLEIKKNIRKFKGYGYNKDDEKFQDLLGRINRLKSKSMLTSALSLVGLSVGGTRDELVERLATFLVSPSLVERSLPKKRSGKKRSSKKKSKGSAKPKESKKKRKMTAAKNEASESESVEEESDSEAKLNVGKLSKRKREEQESSEDEDSEPELKRRTPAKRKTMLTKEKNDSNDKVSRRDGKKSKEAPLSKKSKEAPLSKKSKEAPLSQKRQDDPSDGSSDEEFLIKKVKPSDADIESFIKTYMKSVNLEEVTMKNIYQRVIDEYPNVDMASKKDFIRSTVKQILA